MSCGVNSSTLNPSASNCSPVCGSGTTSAVVIGSGSKAPTVIVSFFSLPCRTTVKGDVVPGLVLPTTRGKSSDFSIATPSNSMMTSPGSKPALAAGEPASTPLTNAPRGLPKPNASAVSLSTFAMLTPMRPRVTKPWLRNCVETRTASSMGMAKEIP